MAAERDGAPVRLAEIVAALSLGIDLGFSQPMEHVLRQCLIALRIADRIRLSDDDRVAVYYSALLVNVGCHSDAHEQAKWFGDDIALKATKFDHEQGSAREALGMMRLLGAGGSPLHRIRTGVEFAVSGRHDVDNMMAQHAALARGLADRLELPAEVGEALVSSYERWDGKGWPGEVTGDECPVAARIVHLAEYTEVAYRRGGAPAARELAERRSGSQFDPALVQVLCDASAAIFDGLTDVGTWQSVIDAEPKLTMVLSGQAVDRALQAIAEFVDLKSPYTLGHSVAVAELAAAAGRQLGLGGGDLRALHRAGLVHEFGRLGVSNAIWDKPGPLGAGEWERVRLHPYYAERMLQQSDALAPLGRIVVQQRERLDGSGYPRGLPGSAISPLARILGAADAYQAMREERPHRPAHPPAAAAAELRSAALAGHLDADAVDAVLAAAGHRVPRRQDGPAGLTAREVEVLKLVALGLSTKQIAARLVIAPKTAGNHIEHIYAKIGTSSRAAAALFAMQHGLLPEEGFPSRS
ncbi:MAG TPA: HD domain-containing phosphohydrolase [Acidimicrobiales bacterium]|nr:HD domain-containing phosphohydrolase [Acidimicrobiales bacterium]